jgi:chromosome segregation ATPase
MMKNYRAKEGRQPLPALFDYPEEAASLTFELSELRERIVRLEMRIETVLDKRDAADSAKETAVQALQAAKSAHHRLDEMADNQRWLWRTAVGTILASAAALLTNFHPG